MGRNRTNKPDTEDGGKLVHYGCLMAIRNAQMGENPKIVPTPPANKDDNGHNVHFRSYLKDLFVQDLLGMPYEHIWVMMQDSAAPPRLELEKHDSFPDGQVGIITDAWTAGMADKKDPDTDHSENATPSGSDLEFEANGSDRTGTSTVNSRRRMASRPILRLLDEILAQKDV